MTRIKKEKPYLDAKELTLAKWLSIVLEEKRERENSFIDYQFPTDSHAQEYISTIAAREDAEIKNLIRCFLIPAGVLGHDHSILRHWTDTGNILHEINNSEYARRLIRGEAWEGMTWILDLLPHSPKQAIDALNAFIKAHGIYLPDGRFTGLCDALSIIRHKYILTIGRREVLDEVSPRDFEFLISALLRAKKYNVRVTQKTRDGGADIICTTLTSSTKQTLLVECKHYTGSIGVDVVRQLAGVVGELGASSGLVVTSGRFTKPAIDFANKTGRIQLMDYAALNLDFNLYFGARWGERLSLLIGREQLEQVRGDNASC